MLPCGRSVTTTPRSRQCPRLRVKEDMQTEVTASDVDLMPITDDLRSEGRKCWQDMGRENVAAPHAGPVLNN